MHTKPAKPMNQSTQLNSELLSADARGRKHIPVAVFAVILIHVVLFLVLLIAAGCRSSARAKQNVAPAQTAAVAEALPAMPQAETLATVATPVETPLVASTPVAAEQIRESVVAMEVIEPESPALQPQPARTITQQAPATKKPVVRTTAKSTVARKDQFYVVKPGDTLDKIAKRHGVTIQAMRTANKMKGDLIFPGQKLQLSPVNAAQAEPKKKRSNEV